MNSLEYAKMSCDTIMRQFPDGVLPPVSTFNYHAGVFLHGMEELYLQCGDKKYDEYILNWLLKFVDETGFIKYAREGELDSKQAANLLLRYCKENRFVPQFKIAADNVAKSLLYFPKNKHGGFFHMAEFPHQMWLDGAYMASYYLVRYSLTVKDRRFIDLAAKQMRLIYEHTWDEKTGLLYHAWDASGWAEWADKKTGCSSEIWGRALGWYIATTALIGELLTPEDEIGKEIIALGVSLADSLLKFQDEKTGMWYQVVDKGGNVGNWIESSCSCLFTFAMLKLMCIGALSGEKYEISVKRAYKGIVENYAQICADKLFLKDICLGTGVGDYDYYINRPTEDNDLHGVGAFLLMTTEYYKMFGE